MSKKHRNLYSIILEGIRQNLSDDDLQRHIEENGDTSGSKASSKRIVKAALLGFSDEDLVDAEMIARLAALAARHRSLALADRQKRPALAKAPLLENSVDAAPAGDGIAEVAATRRPRTAAAAGAARAVRARSRRSPVLS
ncbi:hypothetical protein [Rhizobium sp. SSA_523]|uniref:hypothetical protein n=1 Tax=Rhizobium sp. SSA_523 TaxID=2952477 RepID=UPI0020901B27|nr:hypothetical protein [Rhizobium sp. SSA_523]MCO5733787.1 hypothetical protein [Rhizobium sp. SSA_523]WKC24938.1 hypothetical protein QTJ18_13095 [Rhizobium sp. SSA_523]